MAVNRSTNSDVFMLVLVGQTNTLYKNKLSIKLPTRFALFVLIVVKLCKSLVQCIECIKKRK